MENLFPQLDMHLQYVKDLQVLVQSVFPTFQKVQGKGHGHDFHAHIHFYVGRKLSKDLRQMPKLMILCGYSQDICHEVCRHL